MLCPRKWLRSEQLASAGYRSSSREIRAHSAIARASIRSCPSRGKSYGRGTRKILWTWYIGHGDAGCESVSAPSVALIDCVRCSTSRRTAAILRPLP